MTSMAEGQDCQQKCFWEAGMAARGAEYYVPMDGKTTCHGKGARVGGNRCKYKYAEQGL